MINQCFILPVASLVILSVESNRDTNIGSIAVELFLADAHGLVLLGYTLREWNITSKNKLIFHFP